MKRRFLFLSFAILAFSLSGVASGAPKLSATDFLPPLQASSEEEKSEGEGEEAASPEEEEPVFEDGVHKIKAPEPNFGAVDSHLLRPTKLPDTVFFKDLHVEHRQYPVEGGKEFIYFFPNGYVERAIINLRDEEDEVNYSLATNPISGRVSIEPEYRSLGRR